MGQRLGCGDASRAGWPWPQAFTSPVGLGAPLLQELGHEELFVAVEMLSAVVLINQALEAGDIGGFWSNLVNPASGLAEVEGENAQR